MKKISLILNLLLITGSVSYSQEFTWRTRLFTFFDNIEFGRSAFKIPQTMAGVMIAPEAGFVWDSVNGINAGINLMHEFGSSKAVDRIYPTAYYSYNKAHLKFNMGAFPRSLAVEDYPHLFFQDSISYYRPNINGVSLKVGNDKGYLNLWLDWTGRQSNSVREAFFVGLSGRYRYNILYVQHFDYMFHFAGKSNPVTSEALHDNLLFLTSAGVDLSGRTFFEKLDFNAGWAAGLERARADNTGWVLMSGFITEARVEYKYFGLYNSFFKGTGFMNYYNDHSIDLYWGDPVYRAGTYDRLDLYIKFLREKKVNIDFTLALHFLENRIYNEQLLKIKVNLNKFINK
jgi:hypothetical protein